MKYQIIFLLILTVSAGAQGCKKKVEQYKVDLDQIETDGSTNDKYIFKNEIEKEKWKESRYKKKKF